MSAVDLFQFISIKTDKERWTRTQSPEMNSCIDGHLMVARKARDTRWRSGSLFKERCWENRIFTWKRTELDLYLIPLTKLSKWIKDLHVRPEIIKLPTAGEVP